MVGLPLIPTTVVGSMPRPSWLAAPDCGMVARSQLVRGELAGHTG